MGKKAPAGMWLVAENLYGPADVWLQESTLIGYKTTHLGSQRFCHQLISEKGSRCDTTADLHEIVFRVLFGISKINRNT